MAAAAPRPAPTETLPAPIKAPTNTLGPAAKNAEGIEDLETGEFGETGEMEVEPEIGEEPQGDFDEILAEPDTPAEEPGEVPQPLQVVCPHCKGQVDVSTPQGYTLTPNTPSPESIPEPIDEIPTEPEISQEPQVPGPLRKPGEPIKPTFGVPSMKGVSISKVNADGTLEKQRGWFGDPEEHARAAARRGASSGPEPKDGKRRDLRTATTAVGAATGAAAGATAGMAALSHLVSSQLMSEGSGKIGSVGNRLATRVMMASRAAGPYRLGFQIAGGVLAAAAGGYLGSRLFRKPKQNKMVKQTIDPSKVSEAQLNQADEYVRNVLQAIQNMSPEEQKRFASTLTPEEAKELQQITQAIKGLEELKPQSTQAGNNPGSYGGSPSSVVPGSPA